jgi:hypothetical protein
VAAPAVAAAPVSKAVAATIHGRAVPAVAVAAAPAVAADQRQAGVAVAAPVAESDMGTVTGLTVVDALEGKSVVGTVTG